MNQLVYADLHTHTTSSDGNLSPTELVIHAKNSGLQVIGITDHDTVFGVEEALKVGEKVDIQVVPGIELSTSHAHHNDIHLVGLFIDYQNTKLRKLIGKYCEGRKIRAGKIIRRVNKVLMKKNCKLLDEEDIFSRAKGMITRSHIAEAMVEHGISLTQNDAFDNYLTPLNVPKQFMTAAEGIAFLHELGGVSVLAHPHRYSHAYSQVVQLIIDLNNLGLDALETQYAFLSPLITKRLKRLADMLDLLESGGSDYHYGGPERELGTIGIDKSTFVKLHERSIVYK